MTTTTAIQASDLRVWNATSIIHERSGLEVTPISGKARARALMAYLRTLPDGSTFQDYRVAAFAWRALNPRGKRSGWVEPENFGRQP